MSERDVLGYRYRCRSCAQDMLRFTSTAILLVAVGLLVGDFLVLSYGPGLTPVLDVYKHWFTDLLGGAGLLFATIGIIGTCGAWSGSTGPIHMVNGATLVLLPLEVGLILMFLFNRSLLNEAAKNDDTGGLAKILSWIDRNAILAAIFTDLFMVLQLSMFLLGSGFGICSSSDIRDKYELRHEHWSTMSGVESDDPRAPLLPHAEEGRPPGFHFAPPHQQPGPPPPHPYRSGPHSPYRSPNKP